jgi:hypothetical protein
MLPGSKLVVMPGVGHMPHEVTPMTLTPEPYTPKPQALDPEN